MIQYKLYYLSDESGDIYGDKLFIDHFSSLTSALQRAISDAKAHYSVESNEGDGQNYSIIYCV